MKNKTLLITGGTGSFGNAVLDLFLPTDIGEIRIFSRDEKKQHDMRMKYGSDKIKYVIGDVRDQSSVNSAMVGVDYVFSAAALKQVPSCEFHPIEAVKTNILGTENVLNAAINNNVKKVVCLSTDKAVYPINAMGMSKALMEKVSIAKARTSNMGTVICNTRYGNVMGTRGSVLPIFIEQLKSGKPITITDPEMTRFMMSLQEAVELVLYAFNHGEQGDTFVQKSPSGTIANIAAALCDIFGVDSDYKVIGTRHGEKKHEVLIGKEEMLVAKDRGAYYSVPMNNNSINYQNYCNGNDKLTENIHYGSDNTHILSIGELVDMLKVQDFVKEALCEK